MAYTAVVEANNHITLKDADHVDRAPDSYGGTPVLLSLAVDDVDAVGAAMERAGATVVFAIGDAPYGRMGRFADPFGHVWMLAQEAGGA